MPKGRQNKANPDVLRHESCHKCHSKNVKTHSTYCKVLNQKKDKVDINGIYNFLFYFLQDRFAEKELGMGLNVESEV